MNRQAGYGLALIGAVLAIVALFIDYANHAGSYWDLDGTIAAVGLGAAIIALALAAGAWVGQGRDGWLFAVGAFLVGYWGFFPAVTAFDDWDQTRAGLWLAFVGGLLIAVGAAWAISVAGGARSTPAGTTPAALAAGLGIVLVFPGIFLDASTDGTSYWNASGHSLGIVMLIVAILAALAWAATTTGTATRGVDAALTLVLLGLTAFNIVGSAFGDFGSLDVGAWLAFAGGILAAGGTWAARGAELPHAAAMPA